MLKFMKAILSKNQPIEKGTAIALYHCGRGFKDVQIEANRA